MKVVSSISSHAWNCLAVLAIAVFTTGSVSPSRVFGPLFRPQRGVAFTLGVDEEALRESAMAEVYDTNDTAAVQARVDEALKGSDERVIEVVRRRLAGLGMHKPVVQGMKGRRILVKLPGIDKKKCAEVRRALQRRSFLEFRLTHPHNQALASDLLASGNIPEGYAASARGDGFVRAGNYHAVAARAGYKARLAAFGKPPQGYQLMLEKSRDGTYRPNYVSRKNELTGEYLVSADVDRDEMGRPVVAFRLNGKGGNLMRKLTRNYIAHGEKNSTDRGRELAIVLDGELISVPVLQSEISTRGQISGSFDVAEAQRLANDLNAGALPVPLVILAEDTWVEH